MRAAPAVSAHSVQSAKEKLYAQKEYMFSCFFRGEGGLYWYDSSLERNYYIVRRTSQLPSSL
jgi:hypothetical protein